MISSGYLKIHEQERQKISLSSIGAASTEEVIWNRGRDGKTITGCEYVIGKIRCCKYLGERHEDSGRRAGNLTEMKVDSILTQLQRDH